MENYLDNGFVDGTKRYVIWTKAIIKVYTVVEAMSEGDALAKAFQEQSLGQMNEMLETNFSPQSNWAPVQGEEFVFETVDEHLTIVSINETNIVFLSELGA